MKDQLAKVLKLLTIGRGNSVTGTSSQVEVDLNQVLEDHISNPITESGKKLSEE